MMMRNVFINRFIDFLDDCNAEEAIQLMKKDLQLTEESLYSVMSAIVSNLTSSTLQHKKAAFECSSKILTFIAENCNPIRTTEVLEKQVKPTSDHVNFCAIMNALNSCAIKVQDKRIIICWCLNAFEIYVKNLPLPDEVDDDPEAASDRIIETYKIIMTFLDPFVQEARNINSRQEKESKLGKYLVSFFIFLCGKPFCCLNKHISKETVYEELVDNTVTQACCLTADILYLLDVVGQRERQSTSGKVQSQKIPILSFTWSYKVSNIAYANFFFNVIIKENYWINVPQVYNSYYILETCAYFFKILLSEDYSISNGLAFMENVIKRIPPNSVDSEVLGLDIYSELFQSITKVMIYSNSDKQRKRAVRVFQEYIEIFNMEARYTIILYLYEIVEHSSLLSFITGIFKSSIIQCLDSTPQNPQFLGKNMELLLKKACNLPHGSSSDIAEISDEIIAALNLLRFLFIRDKNNETGIWNMVDILKNDYLNPLREGINLCRAHWTVKIKDLEQQKKDLAKEQDYSKLMKANMEVTLTVGGEQLPAMPLPQKTAICYQVLNGLDVMESILIRVNECINMNEKFMKKSDECME